MSTNIEASVYQPEDIVDITSSDIPRQVQYELLPRIRRFSGLAGLESLDDCQRLMRLGSLGEYCVFFAQYQTLTPISATAVSEGTNISLADISPEGSIVGVGDILSKPQRPDVPPFDPVVGTILTKDPYKGMGYGTKRYLAMNAVCLLAFGQSLSSRPEGNFRTPAATRRWEAFVRRGLAEQYETIDDSGRPFKRYRFKTT